MMESTYLGSVRVHISPSSRIVENQNNYLATKTKGTLYVVTVLIVIDLSRLFHVVLFSSLSLGLKAKALKCLRNRQLNYQSLDNITIKEHSPKSIGGHKKYRLHPRRSEINITAPKRSEGTGGVKLR